MPCAEILSRMGSTCLLMNSVRRQVLGIINLGRRRSLAGLMVAARIICSRRNLRRKGFHSDQLRFEFKPQRMKATPKAMPPRWAA